LSFDHPLFEPHFSNTIDDPDDESDCAALRSTVRRTSHTGFLLPPRLTSTFLTLLLLPLQDDVLVVLPPPGDGGLRRALGLADEGGVVVLAYAHGGG